MKTNIVLLEDELEIGEVLKELLDMQGFNCTHYTNVNDLMKHPFAQVDLYLLDYHLDGQPEGIHAAKQLREMGVICPVIMLTSERDEEVIVRSFKEAEVDDYLNKPVRIDELSVRINKHLSKSKLKKRIVHNDVTIDIEAAAIFVGSKQLDITHSEFRIIQCLLENKGKVLPRQDIINYINEEQVIVGQRTIDTQINTIRKKISEDSMKITSKRSFGYGVMV